MAGGKITHADIAQEITQLARELNNLIIYATGKGLAIKLDVLPSRDLNGRQVPQVAVEFDRTE